jgi:hypothetical protein
MTAAFWMWPLAGVLVLAGLAGTILPVLPGVPLVFVGLFVAAWADDFQRVTWLPLLLLGLLTVLSFVIDFAATAFGVRRVGATRLAIIGAVVGTLVGIFFGIPGLIFGPFVGAVVGELRLEDDQFLLDCFSKLFEGSPVKTGGNGHLTSSLPVRSGGVIESERCPISPEEASSRWPARRPTGDRVSGAP